MMVWRWSAILCLLWAQISASCYWQPHVSGTGRIGSYREGGSLEVWVPFVQGPGFVTFVQGQGARLRRQWTAGGGAGFRRMLSPCCAVGLNGFADWNRSYFGVNRLQLGVGGEVFGSWWHTRINGYFPQQRTTLVNLGTRSIIELIGNDIILQEIEEQGVDQGYKGLDVEAGALPFCSRWVELWAYAGGYGYWADQASPIYGPRLRLEYRMEDLWGWCQARFTVGGEWQYDKVRGHQSAFVATLRLPLGYRNASNCCPRRSICRRMGDTVHRNLGATVVARNFGEAVVDRTVTEAFFVWETNISGAGTQEDPTSLPDAMSRAGPGDIIIFLQDMGNIQIGALGTNSIMAQAAQQFRGYGNNGRIEVAFPQGGLLTITPLPGRSGARAILDGVAGNDAFLFATTNIADGLQVNDAMNQIHGTNVALAVVNDMILRDATTAGLFFQGTGTARITNSTITGAGVYGIRLSDTIAPQISNNAIVEGESRGLFIEASQATPVTGSIRNNSFVSTTAEAILLEHTGSGSYTLAFDGNKMTSTMGAGGIFSNVGDCDLLQFTSFANNTVIGGASAAEGILVQKAQFTNASGGQTVIGTSAARVNGAGLALDEVRGTLNFDSLSIANNNGVGLFIRDCDGKSGTFMFGTAGGTIDTTVGPAIDIDPVTLACTFSAVSSSASPLEGIKLNTVAGDLVIQGGDITGSTGDAFSITGPTSLNFTYSGTATNTSGSLILVNGLTGGRLTWNGSSMTDTGADGISIQNAACSVNITNTSIDSPTQDAITLMTNTGQFIFNQGEINNAMFRGVNAANIGDFIFTNNMTDSNNSGANNFILVNGFGSTLTFTDNTLTETDTSQSIVSLATSDALSHTVQINGNAVSNTVSIAQSNGIQVQMDAPDSSVLMNSNTVSGNINAVGLLSTLAGTNRLGTFEMSQNTVDITGGGPGASALLFRTAAGTQSARLRGTMDQNTVTIANGDGLVCCELQAGATGTGVIGDITVTNNKITPNTGNGIRIGFGQSSSIGANDALVVLLDKNMCDSCGQSAVRLNLGTGGSQSGMISATITDTTDTNGAAGVAVYDIGNTILANSTTVCGTLTGNATTRPAMGIVLDQSGFEVIRITDLSNLSTNNNGMTVIPSGSITNIGTTTCPVP